MKKKIREKAPEKVWADFKRDERLTDEQLAKFQAYEALLTEWNKKMNLTAIQGLSETVHRHFADSLALRSFLDVREIGCVADVGSGGGFPGVPLKIMYPHLRMILIEVSHKRQRFLQAVINALDLKDIEVCPYDWRTFLRTTESDVEYFLTRASLYPVEMMRMFKPGCFYKHAKLVYWAASDWEPAESVQPFVKQELVYTLKRKKRKLVLMEKGEE